MRHGEIRVESRRWPRNADVFQVLLGTNRTGMHSFYAHHVQDTRFWIRAVFLCCYRYSHTATQTHVLSCCYVDSGNHVDLGLARRKARATFMTCATHRRPPMTPPIQPSPTKTNRRGTPESGDGSSSSTNTVANAPINSLRRPPKTINSRRGRKNALLPVRLDKRSVIATRRDERIPLQHEVSAPQ